MFSQFMKITLLYMFLEIKLSIKMNQIICNIIGFITIELFRIMPSSYYIVHELLILINYRPISLFTFFLISIIQHKTKFGKILK